MQNRIFVEKKPDFCVEAQGLLSEAKLALNIAGLREIRVFNRYDALSDDDISPYIYGVFAEAMQDYVYSEMPDCGEAASFASALLKGQYDSRSDAAIQCLALKGAKGEIKVQHAKAYALIGDITPEEAEAVKNYIVNPVDMRFVDISAPPAFDEASPALKDRGEIPELLSLTSSDIPKFLQKWSLAMSEEDLAMARDYFLSQNRAATEAELKSLDAYWSDHCRHTTFNASISLIAPQGENPMLENAYSKYLEARASLGLEGLTLMGVANTAYKIRRQMGLIKGAFESEENNACTFRVRAKANGVEREFLLMFKNETHNHPTEIEPFGGAATCIGGAIRDPLSQRAAVYQSMRVTGAGDITAPVSQAIKGKLPQRKISREAALGFSSYGNQFGLATGLVREYYHPGFLAKRLECGAVVASAPVEGFDSRTPEAGDLIYVVGGRTGRDGIGGASGSSKAHNEASVTEAAGEVQKGNAPNEHKLQRLFSNPRAAKLMKRSNDFGAGGVSVAIGEIADSIDIFLDTLLPKYSGLKAFELAVSESQERMAALIAPESEEEFLSLIKAEGLEASRTAIVTGTGRLRMFSGGENVFDIERRFIATSGAPRQMEAELPEWKEPNKSRINASSFEDALRALSKDLNTASQRGIGEMFDSTIGAGAVLLPYGGSTQKAPSDVMAHIIPGTDSHASVMAHGYDPYLASENAYLAARSAVALSLARIASAGCDISNARLSLQEYFAKLDSPKKTGVALSAMLGAFEAQMDLGVPAIGGKDSMSGNFGALEVPPSLISFAIADCEASQLVANVIQSPGRKVWLLMPKEVSEGVIDLSDMKDMLASLLPFYEAGEVECAQAVGYGGVLEAAFKMCVGEGLGFAFDEDVSVEGLTKLRYGAILAVFKDKEEVKEDNDPLKALFAQMGGDDAPKKIELGHPEELSQWASYVGEATSAKYIKHGEEGLPLDSFLSMWEGALSSVFPTEPQKYPMSPSVYTTEIQPVKRSQPFGQPLALIPAFSGTNCEYDTLRAFERAGAKAEVFVFSPFGAIEAQETAKAFAEALSKAQILCLPGGFSAADEPDGSAKYIAAALSNPYVMEACLELAYKRDGLILGICNGFQALIKSGLLPSPEISATLTFNSIGRHIARIAHVRVASSLSPWLKNSSPGEIYKTAISHGEGRLFASEDALRALAAKGQIAQQYCGPDGTVSEAFESNPNGSSGSVEALTDETGRILGKMGHSERIGPYLYKNMPGSYNQGIFEAGREYFL